MKKTTVALDRALSKLGILSRSQARKAIVEGKISVNGRITKNPEQRVVPENIHISVEGVTKEKAPEVYMVFYKPVGFVTTTRDEKNRPTIFDLLPQHYGKLTCVGRLDMHTSGLLLLTTNTQIAHYLTDPCNGIERTYIAGIEGFIQKDEIQSCLQGIEDQGEILKAKSISVLKSSQKESLIEIILTQGKNREIRRLMQAIDHPVIKLKRIAFGNIKLDLEKPGQWKLIDHFL